jgi:hypothetical protein
MPPYQSIWCTSTSSISPSTRLPPIEHRAAVVSPFGPQCRCLWSKPLASNTPF